MAIHDDLRLLQCSNDCKAVDCLLQSRVDRSFLLLILNYQADRPLVRLGSLGGDLWLLCSPH